MTNHWIDIKNSDCILIMGANPAENHPISFKWILKAMENGALLIHVDPRFTRTSSRADIYAPIRPGSDIAFLGGMINYILTEEKFFRKYIVHYTNAPFIVSDAYSFEDGLFSGYDPLRHGYDRSSWAFVRDEKGIPERDYDLKHPRCVFRQLKRHFSRYTPDRVAAATGMNREDVLRVYAAYTATGTGNRTGTIMYAMGWTQHTVGVQNIRAMAIIQLLLGNIGRPGGGVNALRGESNVQGSTDHCLLFHILPGYLKTPRASQGTLDEYNRENTPKSGDPLSANWWGNYPKYSVSLLKAMFGRSATKENQFGYSWLPRLDDEKDYSWMTIIDEMYNGRLSGFFAWGQNPACSGANSNKTRHALTRLEWLVSVNLFDNETASFWKGPGMDPKKIKTEVFLLPCAASVEKEGSITNSGRWMQWRYKAADPPEKCRSDGDIMVDLFERIRSLYEKGGKFPEPILNLRREFSRKGKFDVHAVARLINGYFEEDVAISGQVYKKGSLVPSFTKLKADGSTSSGNWLYCGSYTEKGNMAARRGKKDPSGMGLYPEWAWCWPINRRIIYNRASVDLRGKPWSPNKNILEYVNNRWVGDVPDGGWPPMADTERTRLPFIMKADGVASLFGPGLVDGPFPEHYEPVESPLKENPFSSRRINPAARVYSTDADRLATGDTRFPLIGTTYRVTEHWQTGVMTRWQPWLLEAQPRLFVEMSHELAGLRDIKNGDRCLVISARGEVDAVAIVTARLRPFKIMGRTVHMVGLPWCFGWLQPKDGGDAANLLTPSAGDPNTRIPETKAFMVNVVKRGG